MRTVITYGTFDTLHFGHILLLQRAKAMGDYLVVALSTDEFNGVKGKKSHFNYEQRKWFLEQLKCVDKVIPETCWEQKATEVKYYDYFVMGDDWAGKFDEFNCVYVPRTKGISSTIIRKNIKHESHT